MKGGVTWTLLQFGSLILALIIISVLIMWYTGIGDAVSKSVCDFGNQMLDKLLKGVVKMC